MNNGALPKFSGAREATKLFDTGKYYEDKAFMKGVGYQQRSISIDNQGFGVCGLH